MVLNWSELAVFVGACASAVAGLIIATQKSKCSNINCCYGLIGCERSVSSTLECQDLESQLQNIVDIPNDTIRESAPTPRRAYGENLPVRPDVQGGV